MTARRRRRALPHPAVERHEQRAQRQRVVDWIRALLAAASLGGGNGPGVCWAPANRYARTLSPSAASREPSGVVCTSAAARPVSIQYSTLLLVRNSFG